MKKILSLVLIILININLNAQEQITDFKSQIGDKSSSPSNFIEFNESIYFTATTESFGREIWKTNGNTDNAVLLKDINPGNDNGIISPSFVILNNLIYFIASDGTSSGELWQTDGTTQGTFKVTNFINSNTSGLTLVNNEFFFLTQTSDSSLQRLWKSNGTSSGTIVVKEDIPASSSGYKGKLNDLFMFSVRVPSTNGSKVWRSDGTELGTYSLTDALGGNGSGSGGTSFLSQYINFNNELYFIVRSSSIFGTNSVGIMKTDGTIANTVPVKGIHNGSNAGGTTGIINYGSEILLDNKLYFSFFQKDFNRLFIWETDGTEINTNKIYDLNNSTYFIPSELSKKNNSLIFCSGNASGGTSLFDLNVINSILTEIKELANNTPSPRFFSPTNSFTKIDQINSNQFFIDVSLDRSISTKIGWVSDFTTSFTSRATYLDQVRSVFSFNDLIYFSKSSTMEGFELWRSDGSQSNTLLIDNINKSNFGLSPTTSISVLNKSLIFNTNDGLIGDELWIYNTNNSELNLLKDINIGPNSSTPRELTLYNNNIFFSANDNINGNELWKTDGSASGTLIAHNINQNNTSSIPRFLKEFNNSLYFIARRDNLFYLFKKTESELITLKDLGQDFSGGAISATQLETSGNYIYFSTISGTLWRSDGTESGTIILKTFNDIGKMIDVNGTLYFPTSSSETNGEIELHKSDGTIAGTVLVKNIEPGFSAFPTNLTNVNGVIYFSAETSNEGRELWKSDGTENGTIQVTDINPGVSGSISNPQSTAVITFAIDQSFNVLENEVFFNANDNVNGSELWKSDGTESGTLLVKDINSGSTGSNPSEMTVINNELYFQAYDQENGTELWKSDGSTAGTTLISNILPGNQSSLPSNILAIDNDLFFAAETINDGRQIWKFRNGVTLSTSEFSNNELISIYPNPARDLIHINTRSQIDKMNIYDLNGRLIKSYFPTSNSIDIAEINPGMYLMVYVINGTTNTKKVIKI
ncbi:T9SS C-terminal target domain-containing protein [Flavobacteriaceae bacterium AU392]|nr:T9SS C-terminal target domain-containing protein [Flavobacteriaceae bacterium]RKM84191.1 T9SS C-terminal target domain-containing protein [Flavobacteriaceae bacterium AU392]